MAGKRVITVSELTSGGFIRETTSQLRNSRMVETVELLDPNPDCYRVYMKRISVRRRNKPKERREMEWAIARPFDGHMPKGGYDIISAAVEQTPHFDMFAQAKAHVDAMAEQYIELWTTIEDLMENVSRPINFSKFGR